MRHRWSHEPALALFGLRPGEGRPVGLAVAASFFASAGLMIGGSGIEALFFARYGVSKLPVMYLALGVTMFLLTLGFGALLGRVGRGRACLLVPIALARSRAAGRIALAADIAWITQALWLLQGAAQFLVALSVWGLAGLVTDTRQAKRFFPLIGAGGVLGYVIGGLATKPLASWIGAPNLLLVWIATLVTVVVLGARLLAIGGRAWPRAEPTDRDPVRSTSSSRGCDYAAAFDADAVAGAGLDHVLAAVLLPLPAVLASRDRALPRPRPARGLLRRVLRRGDRRRVPAVALRDEPAPCPLRRADRAARAAAPVPGRVRRPHHRDPSFVILAIFRFAQVAWLSGGAISSYEAVVNTVPADRRDQTRAFLYGGPTQVGTVLAGVIALVGEFPSPAILAAIGFACAVDRRPSR